MYQHDAIPKVNGVSSQGFETATFFKTENKRAWRVVDDGVMGGKSKSHFTVENDSHE